MVYRKNPDLAQYVGYITYLAIINHVDVDLGNFNQDSISKGPVKISMQSLSFPQLISKATHIRGVCFDHIFIMMMLMMTMMIMMNCFCGMVDWRQVFSLISCQEPCQRSSVLRISDTPRAGF